MISPTKFLRCTWAFALCAAVAALPAALGQTSPAKRVKVTIQEDKTEFTEQSLPLDETLRIRYEYTGAMSFGVTGEGNKMLTCGAGAAQTMFKIDGQLVHPDEIVIIRGGQPQPAPAQLQPLPPGPNNKKRTGQQVIWTHGDINITMVMEVVPGKPYAKNAAAVQKRRMDTLLIKYVIVNTGAKPHQVGARMHIDAMCGQNDGAIFASPATHPGRLLDGVMFKDKEVPEFIEMLERPNLQNPGFKGVFTFKLSNKLEGPDRVVLTNLGADGGDGWDIRAFPANGDSAVAFFWEPKEVKANSKREYAFAIGQSIACNPESEGKVSISLGGSFEPHKVFTVTAYVDDIIEGQNLTLELPKGMERLEGRPTQTVPHASGDGLGVVMWRCRVLELGTFPIRVRSSNGVTQTRVVTVAPEL